MNREEVMAMDFDEFKEFVMDHIEGNYEVIEKQSELNEKTAQYIGKTMDLIDEVAKTEIRILEHLRKTKQKIVTRLERIYGFSLFFCF